MFETPPDLRPVPSKLTAEPTWLLSPLAETRLFWNLHFTMRFPWLERSYAHGLVHFILSVPVPDEGSEALVAKNEKIFHMAHIFHPRIVLSKSFFWVRAPQSPWHS